jgi:pimeloyl-ACP methyl ester carboxylesterase
MADDGFTSVYTSAPDGLRLHARDYGSRLSDRLPVVCLSGLTRNAADFHELALALSGHRHRPRRVVAIDYRGRGLSDRDPDWKNYDVKIEVGDVMAQLVALGVAEAIFVGTSRGGLVTMGLSAARPALIRGVVLNDIGPVLDAQGLLRIRSYVGKLPAPRDWTEAAEILKRTSASQSPALTDEDWLAMARGTWREEAGGLVSSYDHALMKPLAALDLEARIPTMWPLFDGLKDLPVLVIRGEMSDLLSRETVTDMAARHPALESFEVPGQGHAPLLRDAATIARVVSFVASVDDVR